MTRGKPDSNTRHTIINRSWPTGCSVNDGVKKHSYLGKQLELHYPSVDDLVHRLNILEPAAKTLKWISEGPSGISGLILWTLIAY